MGAKLSICKASENFILSSNNSFHNVWSFSHRVRSNWDIQSGADFLFTNPTTFCREAKYVYPVLLDFP